MDPVTHVLSGAPGGRALREQFPTKLVYALTILAAWCPDVDNFVGLGPEEYLLHHRGITHSFAGIIIQGALFMGVFRLFGKNFTPLKTFLTALVFLGTHLWLDVITTYGTMLLKPFSDHRFSFGSVFIIDPVFTLTLLVLFLASVFAKRWNKRIATLGLIIIVAYPLGCYSVRETVHSALPPILAKQGLAGRDYTVSTDAFSPIFWKVIVNDGDRVLVGGTTILPSLEDGIDFTEFTAADQDLLGRLGETVSFFKTWQWFAAHQTMIEDPAPPDSNGTRAVTFQDIRFFSPFLAANDWFFERTMPFQPTAVLDEAGQLVEYRYNHHNKIIVYLVAD